MPALLSGHGGAAGVELDLPGDLAADVADGERALTAFGLHAAARLGADNPALGPMSTILLRTESASSSQIEDLTVGARQLALAGLEESRSADAQPDRSRAHRPGGGAGVGGDGGPAGFHRP